jgi:Na+-driven multidrug efflux pump
MAPLFILMLTLLGIRFPIAWMLQGQYHADAIWWSFPVSSALAAVLAMVYYKYGGWRTTTMLQSIERPGVRPAAEVVEDQV